MGWLPINKALSASDEFFWTGRVGGHGLTQEPPGGSASPRAHPFADTLPGVGGWRSAEALGVHTLR
jgi:hypothetical protein